MPLIEDFFKDIDAKWTCREPAKIRLRIIGSAALMLQTDYERGTKDSDVLETAEAGRRHQRPPPSAGGHRHRASRKASQVPLCHEMAPLNSALRHFELEVLDIVDVVVSKLKRFNANDISDVDTMIGKGLVPHGALEQTSAAMERGY